MHAQTPRKWKKSFIVAIFKKGDERNLENCRGITLLNTCHKLYSRILKEKFKNVNENFFL
jgi:hypothetical protein